MPTILHTAICHLKHLNSYHYSRCVQWRLFIIISSCRLPRRAARCNAFAITMPLAFTRRPDECRRSLTLNYGDGDAAAEASLCRRLFSPCRRRGRRLISFISARHFKGQMGLAAFTRLRDQLQCRSCRAFSPSMPCLPALIDVDGAACSARDFRAREHLQYFLRELSPHFGKPPPPVSRRRAAVVLLTGFMIKRYRRRTEIPHAYRIEGRRCSSP